MESALEQEQRLPGFDRERLEGGESRRERKMVESPVAWESERLGGEVLAVGQKRRGKRKEWSQHEAESKEAQKKKKVR